MIENLMSRRHPGFHVHAGPRILPRHADSMENLARYIIRASFAQDRMTYLPREARVIYESRDGNRAKTFDALEWLAAMCSHVPNKGEQMVRYYGYIKPFPLPRANNADPSELFLGHYILVCVFL